MALLRSSPCICATSDKPSKLCDTSTLPLLTFRCKVKRPSQCSYKKKLSFKFSHFIGSSLALLHNLPNISTWPPASAICQTICPSLYWSNNNISLTHVYFTALIQPTATSFPMSLHSHVLLHCARRQPKISSSHLCLVVFLWIHTADHAITLYCRCMLADRWRYFRPYLRLGIN